MKRHIPGCIVFYHLDGPPETCTLTAWHKKVGDTAKRYDLLATIECESWIASIEVLYEEGVVSELLFPVGSTIPDGAIIARITPA